MYQSVALLLKCDRLRAIRNSVREFMTYIVCFQIFNEFFRVHGNPLLCVVVIEMLLQCCHTCYDDKEFLAEKSTLALCERKNDWLQKAGFYLHFTISSYRSPFSSCETTEILRSQSLCLYLTLCRHPFDLDLLLTILKRRENHPFVNSILNKMERTLCTSINKLFIWRTQAQKIG